MWSKAVYVFCSIVILYTSFVFYPKWNNVGNERVIAWDVAGYYWYLPALFIYNDLKGEKEATGEQVNSEYFSSKKNEQLYQVDGHYVAKYASGMAVMYLPFFLTAHLLAEPAGYIADGYSPPYHLALQIGSVLIALIGIWYYRKFLLNYFSDKVTAIMIFLLVVGTNYLNYSAIEGAQTHSWLFTVYVLLLLNTMHFYRRPSVKYSLRIGLLIGIAVLTRPTEIISVLVPLLWGLESLKFSSLKHRLGFLYSNRKHIIIVAMVAIAISAIQIMYWLYAAGKPLVYSYGEQGFSWLSPHFNNYMLSYRSGWLVYTPLLILSFIGIVPFVMKGRNRVMILAMFMMSLYITSAWDIWWYAGMGGRAMIQYYPFVLIPLASLVHSLGKMRVVKWAAAFFILLFTYVNIWFTYNAHASGGLYDPGGMTKQYYWHTVGRFKVPAYVQRFKDTDEYFSGTPKNMMQLYYNDFESDTTATYDEPLDGSRSLYAEPPREHFIIGRFPFNKTNEEWLRGKVLIKSIGHEYEAWRMFQFTIRFYNDDSVVKQRSLRINRFIQPSVKDSIYFDVKVPDGNVNGVDVLFWNPGSPIPHVVDNVAIYSFNE